MGGGPVAVTTPVFTGTIPNIEGDFNDPDIITDTSVYFTGATSYSIAPTVETGWNFDTVTGILTVDTDVVGTFGPYIVTGTNVSGSAASNSFSVEIIMVFASPDSERSGAGSFIRSVAGGRVTRRPGSGMIVKNR